MFYQLGRASSRFHKVHLARAAAYRLDANSSGSGVEIKPNRSLKSRRVSRREHIEQGLTQTISGRTKVQAG